MIDYKIVLKGYTNTLTFSVWYYNNFWQVSLVNWNIKKGLLPMLPFILCMQTWKKLLAIPQTQVNQLQGMMNKCIYDKDDGELSQFQ